MKIIPKCIKSKRHLCASGSILLPLAQKWGLVGAVTMLSAFGTQNVSAASITLTVPTDKALSLDLVPTASGNFNKSDAANITIKTDALAGYTLSVKAKDGNSTDLKNITNPSPANIISSLGATTVSESDFKNAANTTYNNKWGFTFGQGGVDNNFRGLVDSSSVKIGGTTEANDIANTYSIVLGARVDNTIATGTYSNTFIVEASANPVPYKVSYNPNASSDQVKNMPDSNSGQTDTETFIITEQQPTRIGYRFIGWCDGSTTQETDVDICSEGKSYQPSDLYTLKQKSQNVTLLAMWAKESQIMQNWKGCNNLEESTAEDSHEITLIDIRDNKPYYVAKLADGNCWMTENLDLDIIAKHEYTATDTDLKMQKDYTWIPESSTRIASDASWNDSYSTPESYNQGDYCQRIDNYQHIACERHSQTATTTDPHYYLGNHYNFSAAVAQNDTSNATVEYTYETSICPAGWRLPIKEDNPSFKKLLNDTGSNIPILKNPLYFTIAGAWRGVYVCGSSHGYYWTATVYDKTYSYHIDLNYTGNSAPSSNHGTRFDGYSLRCVARE